MQKINRNRLLISISQLIILFTIVFYTFNNPNTNDILKIIKIHEAFSFMLGVVLTLFILTIIYIIKTEYTIWKWSK